MVRTYDAQLMGDNLLKEHNLYSLGWRTIFSKSEKYLAQCFYDEKRIVISTLHLNSCSEVSIKDTILHEIAHALVGYGHGHTRIWINKAIEIGLKDPKPCGHMNVDAGRGIKEVETKAKKELKAIQNLCPKCGSIAEIESRLGSEKFGFFIKLKCGHTIKEATLTTQNLDDPSNWVSDTGKRLFPYQIEGIKFLTKANGRALIADEPGLGKTIQAAGFCKLYEKETVPILWVCKTTLKLQAMKEFLDWFGLRWTACIIENSRSLILPGFKVYIVSMDLLRRLSEEKLKKIGFKTVVADEIQHFKNPDSTRTAELRKLVSMADFFIPLSGTPWKNRGQEYYPVLNMIAPSLFPSYEQFKNTWVDTYYDSKKGKMVQGGIRNIPKFREFTANLVVRRMRDDVLPDLPKINRQIRYVDMEQMYKDSYDKEEEKVAAILKDAILEGKPMTNIAAEIMRLKHITGVAKVQVCIEDIQEFLENTEESEKITVFHHHIDVGNLLQKGDGHTYDGIDKWLKDNDLEPSLRLYGGRSADERNGVIEDFKNNPKQRILIASTLASGEGLNIQFCQNAMMLERQWNPANEEQAELRFSRPLTENDLPPYLKHLATKKTSIRVPYFIADGTIDMMLTELVEKKRLNFRRSMNEKDIDLTWDENEIIRELTDMILKKRYAKMVVNRDKLNEVVAAGNK